ncbi:MAG: anion permease, partial [Deltaproteobacteria bacterium]|nr:anion permease [Deltaproteobacteria bacterium]
MLNKTTMLSARARDLLGGPLLFCLALIALPDAAFAFSARAAVGVMLWMGFWWIRLPVSPAVTALLPVALNALFALAPMGGITSRYFSDIVVLLFGANLISLSWERTGLDKRLALKALCLIGPSIMRQAASWFLAAALLSTVLPNAVVCAVMAPIAVSMLRHIRLQHGAGQPEGTGTDAPGASGMGSAACLILACIAWGSGIGGLGTPLGGAMNLV